MQAFCSPKKSRFPLSFILFHVRRVEREELGMREITQGQRNALLGNSRTTFTSPLSLTSLTRPDGNSAWVLRMSRRSKWKWKLKSFKQEPMSRSMQLHYIPVTAFSDRFIFLSNFPGIRPTWECHDQSQETNWRHCVTGPELSLLHKRMGIQKIDLSVKMPWHTLFWGRRRTYFNVKKQSTFLRLKILKLLVSHIWLTKNEIWKSNECIIFFTSDCSEGHWAYREYLIRSLKNVRKNKWREYFNHTCKYANQGNALVRGNEFSSCLKKFYHNGELGWSSVQWESLHVDMTRDRINSELREQTTAVAPIKK